MRRFYTARMPVPPALRRLVPCAALLLTSAALACPAKPGYVANSLFRAPGNLTAICGPLYLAFQNSLKGAKWTEMYALAAGQPGDAQLARLLTAIQKSGYRQARVQRQARSQVYLFTRGEHSITAVTGVSGPVRYVALAGQ